MLDYRPRLRYLLIDESAYADAELAAQRNLVAALFRLERSRDPEQVQDVLAAVIDWLRAPDQAELRHSFLIWLKHVFLKSRLPRVQLPELHDLEEMRAMLAERLVEWTEQWKQEGLQAGLQQGLQQGLQSERNLVLRLVRRRFGPATAERSEPLLARIATLEMLEQLGEAVLDCADEAAWLARISIPPGENSQSW